MDNLELMLFISGITTSRDLDITEAEVANSLSALWPGDTSHRSMTLVQAVIQDSRECHIIRSNHTDRLYNTLLKVPGLISLPELQYPAFMGFKDMGMEYHKTAYEFHPGWMLAHGDEGNMSQHAGITALNLAKKWGKSVLCGHTHRLGMSAYAEGVGSHYRALYGVEVGNLMDRKKASYLRYGSANWQNF